MDDVFWAAFGGGAAAGVFSLLAVVLGELFRLKSGRPKLEVSARLGGVKWDSQGRMVASPRGEKMVYFEAQNQHNFIPVTVTMFGVRFRRAKDPRLQLYPNHQFPQNLGAGESLVEWTETTELLSKVAAAGKKPSDIKSVWFKSAAGREFRGKVDKETIERLGELHEETQSAGQS